LDGKELRELIDLIAKSDFVTFELERDGFKLKLEKGAGPALAAAAGPPVQAQPEPVTSAPTSSAGVGTAEQAPIAAAPVAVVDASASGLVDLLSPIVGTFYRQPSQAAPPFVEPGSKVKKGQVLCIIEAMKLMNEIESDCEGEVAAVYVENGKAVQFGERLFAVRIS
jgi:acetyl-CoA carboxylase biotin carboxyl carrier protein